MFWMSWNIWERIIPCLKLLLACSKSRKCSVSLSVRVNFLLSAKQQICWMMNWFTDDDVEEVGALHLCTRSLHQPGLWLAGGSPSLTFHWSNTPTLSVVSTPFLQNTIPGSCSGLERCPSNLHTTSSSHIGYLIVSQFSRWLGLATWLPCWHDASTKVATHYTTKSPILLEIMNMQFHVSVNEWKLLICLRILFRCDSICRIAHVCLSVSDFERTWWTMRELDQWEDMTTNQRK